VKGPLSGIPAHYRKLLTLLISLLVALLLLWYLSRQAPSVV
jgi:hypothetical protein